MTDEELEKKAVEAFEVSEWKNHSLHPSRVYTDGYIAGAKENQPTDEEMLKRLSKNGLITLDKWKYPSKGEFPEEFKLVAVSIKGFDYTTTGLYIPKKNGNKYTRTYDTWLCQIPYHAAEYMDNADIIAWQYLPEVPKETCDANS